VNGRNPSRFADGLWAVPRAGSTPRSALPKPVFERSDIVGDEERFVLFGGVKGRAPPFMLDGCTLRLPKLPDSRLATPALGRDIVPFAPRENPAFETPPAGIPPTWLCAIACRRLAVSWVNEAGREILLCVP